jgi:hypothetical protein
MILVLTLAMFTYEAGLWYCLCFLFFMRACAPDNKILRGMTIWFLLPCALYTAMSVGNVIFLGSAVMPETKTVIGGFDFVKTVQNFLMTLKWYISGGMFLTGSDVIPAARLAVGMDVFQWGWPFLKGFRVYYFLGIGMVLAWIVLVWQGRRNIIAKQKGLLGWLAMMLAGYVLIIVLGRVNPLGFAQGMLNTLYYLYNFWVLFIVFLYAAVVPVMDKGGISARVTGWILVVLMCVFIVCNAVMIYRQNKLIEDLYKPTWTFVSQINRAVDEHGKEPGFSFYVRPDHPGNYLGRWFVKGKPEVIYSFTEILYPQFYNDKDPKYVLIGVPSDPRGTLCVRGASGGYQCK